VFLRHLTLEYEELVFDKLELLVSEKVSKGMFYLITA